MFPQQWKHVVIILLYKGKGSRNESSSDRSINQCLCLGKVLEKLVIGQFNAYLQDNDLLNKAQHGFTSGRSTLSNMLATDAHIAQLAASGHAIDIISFDFAKAFDKSPHHAVIKTLANHGNGGTALRWFSSFLRGRTQQYRVNASYSSTFGCRIRHYARFGRGP